MMLAYHPTHPEFPGEEKPLPADWLRYTSPWSKTSFRKQEFGSTLIQELVTPAFALFIWRLHIEEEVRLYPSADKPTIALQFTLGGDIPCKLTGFGEKLLQKGNYEMFYVPIGYNEAWFERGEYESLHIELRTQYLEELAAVRPEIKDLVTRLLSASSKGLPMAVAHTNYITGAVLQNLRTCDKKGPALQLEMHKYILELLCEYLSAILQKEEEEKGRDIPHHALIISVKNYILLAPDIHQHNVKDLARHFRVSETLLKRGFKALFGVGVSEFVRLQVLARTQYLLATTNRTVEDISQEVGYSSREALERSFKKQYGFSPSNLRTDLNG